MTYEVYIDGRLLFYPNDEAYAITNGVVEVALNEAGTFQCDIPKNNPEYIDIEKKVRSSMIEVKQNGKEIFYGEIREVTQNFDMTKHVYAVGELAFLFDSIQPQKRYQNSPFEMFKSLIETHNSQVEDKKKFDIGYVSVADPNDFIYRFTNREDTLTVIRDDLCKSLDGYVRIRKVNDKRYLDLVPLENYGSYCTQEIQFGENLLDYSANYSANDIATAVIPLGARLDDDKRTANAVDGLDEYLTIISVNDGKDYVFSQSAVNQFGWVKVVKSWNDITTPEELKKKAEDWLKSAQFASMELNVNAFDGNLLDINVDSFDVGDTVHAWAIPYGMDTTFPVRKKTTYINDVSKNFITLGTTATTSYTSQASSAVSSVEEQLPQESELLRSAKNNAINMLNGSVGGHVIMKFDEDNKYVEQLLICNASTEKLSTQKWVWNLNGLGFMTRPNISSDWIDLTTAITMDGSIVANFIKSGTLKLAGNGSTATLEIYNGNALIGKWDSSGITVRGGSLNINNTFIVGTNGSLLANNATIKGQIQATSGYIGGESGWQIGNNNIHNGISSFNGSGNGTYIGTDGIVTRQGDRFVRIADGIFNTNGSVGAAGFSAADGNAYMNTFGQVGGSTYRTKNDYGQWLDGASGSITFPANSSGTQYCYLTVNKGIITSIGKT